MNGSIPNLTSQTNLHICLTKSYAPSKRAIFISHFLCGNFYLPAKMMKNDQFLCDKINVFAEKLASWFLCGKLKLSH